MPQPNKVIDGSGFEDSLCDVCRKWLARSGYRSFCSRAIFIPVFKKGAVELDAKICEHCCRTLALSDVAFNLRANLSKANSGPSAGDTFQMTAFSTAEDLACALCTSRPISSGMTITDYETGRQNYVCTDCCYEHSNKSIHDMIAQGQTIVRVSNPNSVTVHVGKLYQSIDGHASYLRSSDGGLLDLAALLEYDKTYIIAIKELSPTND